jgi:hypothetical protein
MRAMDEDALESWTGGLINSLFRESQSTRQSLELSDAVRCAARQLLGPAIVLQRGMSSQRVDDVIVVRELSLNSLSAR